jgi:hypothetical protein
MIRMTVDDSLIQTLILEMAPIITQLTGWDLALSTLRSRVLPREQGYEEILVGRLQQMGLMGWQDYVPDLLERLIEYLIEENTLAAYMHGTNEILVIRENVDDSNVQGLKLILAHELVHRGQHIHHPELFTRVDGMIREAFAEMQNEAPDLETMRGHLGGIQPIMTMLESHAAHVQGQIAREHLPGARVETHFNLARLLMRVAGAPKLAQYTEGLPQVAEAMANGRMESLYRDLEG